MSTTGEMKRTKNHLLAMAKNFDLKLIAMHQAVMDSREQMFMEERLAELSFAAEALHTATDEYVKVWKS